VSSLPDSFATGTAAMRRGAWAARYLACFSTARSSSMT